MRSLRIRPKAWVSPTLRADLAYPRSSQPRDTGYLRGPDALLQGNMDQRVASFDRPFMAALGVVYLSLGRLKRDDEVCLLHKDCAPRQ